MADKENPDLPFKDVEEFDLESITNHRVSREQIQNLVTSKYEHFNFKNFDPTDYKTYELGSDLDPENNFYNNYMNNCEYYTDAQFKGLAMDDNLSVMHFNSRSLNKNFTDIKDYLGLFKKINIVTVSETWLDNEKLQKVEMEGYELFTSNRTNRVGGGVATYVDTAFRCSLVKNMTTVIDNILECVTVEIFFENAKNVMITTVYRTPGSCLDTFNATLDSMFGRVNTTKVHIVCGDYNVDILNPHGHSKTQQFIDTMYSNNLFPLITKPSRITIETATLIDNIFTNSLESQITAGLLINDISDHLPVFAFFQHQYKKDLRQITPTHGQTRVRTPDAINALKTDLYTQIWTGVYAANEPNEAYEAFLTTFTKLYDKHFPLKKLIHKNKQKQEKPWITKGIQNACKKKNLLYKLYLKQRTIETETRYKIYKNKLTNIIRNSKKDYYHKLLEQHKNNIQGTWKILNGIIKKGNVKPSYPNFVKKDNTIIESANEIANEFNNFFVNVGPNLAGRIEEQRDPEGLDERLIPMNPHSIFIDAVNEQDILNIVHKFKNKKSTDNTNIDMKIIKEIINPIVTPLTHICNLSFQTGIFPNKMKTAKVIPIYKSGDKQLLTNYRPISLLSQFSKIIEKLFVERLDKFIDKHHLLSKHQYGFRTNRSTTMAVVELVENISTSINKNEYMVGVFIDLQKAFDTIDHNILLKKLYRYGIRGIALSWLKSYLAERSQYVHLNGVESDTLPVTFGVPQGSVLGPKLFILYINDICEALEDLHCVLFADDTSLYCSGENLEHLLQVVENDLKTLKKWFDINKLSLNISKTKFMIFGNKKEYIHKLN